MRRAKWYMAGDELGWSEAVFGLVGLVLGGVSGILVWVFGVLGWVRAGDVSAVVLSWAKLGDALAPLFSRFSFGLKAWPSVFREHCWTVLSPLTSFVVSTFES